MVPSPSSSGLLLPLPGSPSSSWAVFRARLGAILANANTPVLVSFWLFGLANNALYVIILSAAQDLVGNLPKGVVLLADVLPSLTLKIVAPYFIHRVPYAVRVPCLAGLSTIGMLLIATAPPEAPVAVKLTGVLIASISSGGGELSFLGLTHYYGPLSLAAWGSGTGAAGLAGAGLYVILTDWLSLNVRTSLLVAAILPIILLVSFFAILPRGPLHHETAVGRHAGAHRVKYSPVASSSEDGGHGVEGSLEEQEEDDDVEQPPATVASSLLHSPKPRRTASGHGHASPSVSTNMRRLRALFLPYMLPLLLVYVAEYTINQGVAPTLLFPLNQTPFDEYRAFYPFYGFLYQLGVFVSRSSTPFYRIHRLYVPSVLQTANLGILVAQALYFDTFLPSIYLVFIIIFWEGLLGGAVYVNTFAEIMDHVPEEDREFSLGATSVSDSAGICGAGFVGMALEVSLCRWQVQHGRDWCKQMRPSSH